jgi:hypothetical protein
MAKGAASIFSNGLSIGGFLSVIKRPNLHDASASAEKPGQLRSPPTTLHLQTPVGSLPFQQLADRARDLVTGALLKADFCHAISVFL